MGFADSIFKALKDCEDNPVLQRLRMEKMMRENEKIINISITSKLLSEIADIERIMSKNEAP